MKNETYEERREREREHDFDDRNRGAGHETYDEQLERWKRGWKLELDNDLENAR